MELTAENVNKVFDACQFDPNNPNNTDSAEIQLVRGVKIEICFDVRSVQQFGVNIEDFLNRLPNTFKMSGGQGWSFLNMCVDIHGNQWCDDHITMDKLVCLGIASNLVQFFLPRNMWPTMPGGVPYIQVKL